jgi:hypothetical protein
MTILIDPAKDFEHAILRNSWEYEIVGLRLEKEPTVEHEPFLDLALRRGSERRTLRFWSPSELEIERGGPLMTDGLTIFDIHHRGMENIGVWVTDVEASQGSVRFFARSVEEITPNANQ